MTQYLGNYVILVVLFGIGIQVSNIVSQQLLDDGDCSSPFNLDVVTFEDKGVWFQVSEGAGWYMPWMSQFYASVLYEVFHPRSPEQANITRSVTFEDVKKMCPTIHCSPGNITIFRAYGKEFTMMCKQGQIGNLMCTNEALKVKVNLVAVWSDQKNYALMNTCFLGKKAWFVLATTKAKIPNLTRPDSPYRQMRRKLQANNFNLNNTYMFDYDNCPDLK